MTGADHSTTLYLCLYVTNKMSLREWLEQITQPLCICVCMWLTKCLYGNDWSRSLNHSVSVSVCDCTKCLYGNDWSRSLNHSVSVSVSVWLAKCLYGNDWSLKICVHSTTLYLCLYVTNKMSLREWLEQITQPLCICVCMCDWQNVFTGNVLCLYVTGKMSLPESLNHSVSVSVCVTYKMYLREYWSRSLNHSVSVSVCD